MTTVNINVTSEEDDIRLDRWFKRHYPGLTHALLEKQLRKGLVRLDGNKATCATRLKQGQAITHPPVEAAQLKKPMHKTRRVLTPEEMKEMHRLVLYRDDHLIAINKPQGLAVQGGTGQKNSVDDLLDALQFDLPYRPKLVHRLDLDTSGVLLLARTTRAATALMNAFSGKELQKTYLALVYGQPLPPQGVIDQPLAKAVRGHDSYERVAIDGDDGKRAITEYQVIDMLARKFSVVELKPLTGRTHQLRVHMTSIGCPIVGDQKYGGAIGEKMMDVADILHLHAYKLEIPPMLGSGKITITAPLPKHMKKSFKTLGIEIPNL